MKQGEPVFVFFSNNVVSILFGLILLIQVDFVYSDTGFCYFCQDYLNAIQCNANSNCQFSNGVCTSSMVPIVVDVSGLPCAQKIIANCSGYDVNSTTMQCYQNRGACFTFDNTRPCSTFTNNYQCALNQNCLWNGTLKMTQKYGGNCYSNTCNNSINCTGKDGINPNLTCITNMQTNQCQSFDGSLDTCSSFQYQECNVLQNCYWTQNAGSNNQTNGSCSDATCNDYISQSSCTGIVTSYSQLTARACKWTVNSNNMNGGSCDNGVPGDLSKTSCSLLPTWFTYSDSAKSCKACKQTNTKTPNFSYFVQNSAIPIIIMIIGW